MALVTDFQLKNKEVRVHNSTACTYTTFVDDNGNRYLQLDTYGSDERQIPGKVSQTLQFNAQSAAKLLEIIRECFQG